MAELQQQYQNKNKFWCTIADLRTTATEFAVSCWILYAVHPSKALPFTWQSHLRKHWNKAHLSQCFFDVYFGMDDSQNYPSNLSTLTLKYHPSKKRRLAPL